MEKILLVTLIGLLLSACQTTQPGAPSPATLDIPNGSTLSLNKSILIEQDHTHAIIQGGKITTDSDKDLYKLSCSIQMKAFGPRTLSPDTFTILRTKSGSEQAIGKTILRYYTEIFLGSGHDSDVSKLVCSARGGSHFGHFSVPNMQETLGDYFTFIIHKPKTSPEPSPATMK